MSDDREYLSEDEATRLWRRAAELQAEAARLAEARAASEESERLDADLSADATHPPGYALTHVRAAALEAGISEEFVEAALADIQAEQALPRGGRARRWMRRVLGSEEDAVTARRAIQAPAARVLEVMEEVFPREPYKLAFRERSGDPRRGGVLRFDIQGAGFGGTGPFTGEMSWADAREVLATVRPLGADGCEVTLRAPVAWAYALNVGIAGFMTGFGGFAGFGAGAAAGAVLAALGIGAGAPVFATALLWAGTATGLGGSAAGFRALYRHAIRKGTRALDGLLATVAIEAEGGWGVVPGAQEPARAIAASDDRSGALSGGPDPARTLPVPGGG